MMNMDNIYPIKTKQKNMIYYRMICKYKIKMPNSSNKFSRRKQAQLLPLSLQKICPTLTVLKNIIKAVTHQ